jgi:hypothetical protein
MNPIEYALCVTSCDRHDLLARTIQSFREHVDVEPSRVIILEDSNAVQPVGIGSYEFLRNEPRIGQIRSCDRLMEACDTEFLVWCEDDWLFKEGDFILPSYEILAKYPEIVSVSLRGSAWNHPLKPDLTASVASPGYPFLIAEPGWSGGWGGFVFNPGLRRKSDYLKMGPYAQVGTEMTACLAERELSKLYLAAGYRIADLGRPIIEHLGAGRSKTKEAF